MAYKTHPNNAMSKHKNQSP